VPPAVEGLASSFGPDKKLRVMVALDGRGASAGAIAFVSALRARVACDVTFLRLYWAPEEFKRLGLTGPRDFFGGDPDVVADLDRTLRLQVGTLPGAGLTSFAIEAAWGNPATKILELAAARGEDLVVLGAESRHGTARLLHPAVAEQIAHDVTRIPVVFTPSGETEEARTAAAPAILTVLAPTDLSPVGNRAVPYAYNALAAHGGVVELCYVHERALAAPAYAYEQKEGKLTDIERARLETELRALVPSDARERGITTHVTVIDGGRAAEAILQAAERLVVDQIVLASHGRGGPVRALLGSVSRAVVEQSRRPVLIVPSKRQ
jgi:nucleotide-binding universal stress UspA family protein